MRRIMLLTLLSLALPTVALATSQSYTASTGPLNFTASFSSKNHFQPSSISVRNPWELELVGMNGVTITLLITSLVRCASQNVMNCPFLREIEARGPHIPGLFTDGVSGMINRGPNDGASSLLASLMGTLATNPMVLPGSNLTMTSISICSNTNNVCSGTAGRVSLLAPNGSGTIHVISPMQTPGTLGLFGTGLFGLAGLVRRKLKLGT